MTLTFELPRDIAARFRDEAARRGVDPVECARALLEERLAPREPVDEAKQPPRPFYETATTEEWLREFHAFLEDLRDLDAPVIPLEALRRENLYEDRGL